jgi:hypothetical protein
LRQSTSTDPYRRILDPKIATSLRGRPKNIARPVPLHLAVAQLSAQSQNRQADERSGASLPGGIQPRRGRGRPRGSKNKSTLARLEAQAAIQREGRRSQPICGGARSDQDAGLGPGKAAGVRASGPKVQPSVRRQRSQWESVLSSSDKEIMHNTRSARRRGHV